MNKVILEKTLQLGLVFGIIKIALQIIKLVFLTEFLTSNMFYQIFTLLAIVLIVLFYKRDSDFQNVKASQKIMSLFFVLQISVILNSGFEIYVHEVYDANYKIRIAQQSVNRQKAFDEDFEKKNHAQIVNKEESYASETEKITNNFSLKNLLSRFYFALLGNIFLTFIIYFLSNLSLKKILSQ